MIRSKLTLITHCRMIGSYSSFHVLQWLRENVSITLNIKKKWILVDVMLELLCNYEHSFLIISRISSSNDVCTSITDNLWYEFTNWHCMLSCLLGGMPQSSFIHIPLRWKIHQVNYAHCHSATSRLFLHNNTVTRYTNASLFLFGPWSWLSELGSKSLSFIVKLDRVTR